MSEHAMNITVTIVTAVLASSGMWAFLQKLIERHDKNRFDPIKFEEYLTEYRNRYGAQMNAMQNMLLGLGHNSLMQAGVQYLDRGYVTPDEYENFDKYLYRPYKELGGNGSGDWLKDQVDQLPTRSNKKRGRND